MTYVLVDDDPADLELLRVALSDVVAGRDIVACTNADAALEWLEENLGANAAAPLTVITDLKMPRCDGAQLVETIRRRWPPGPVVIVLSTSERQSDATRAFAAGGNAYHAKPMGFHDTVELCRRIDSYWSTVVPPVALPAEGLGQTT